MSKSRVERWGGAWKLINSKEDQINKKEDKLIRE